MKKLLPLLFFVIPFFALADSTEAMPADTSADTIVKKESPRSVADTMDKFEQIVKGKGLGVFARIDHRKNAQGVEMDMNDAQVLIFGNPKAGTVMMQQDVAVALDLPMRVAVYQAADGKVYIAYHNPDELGASYSLDGNKALPKLKEALDKLTTAAIAE